MAAQNAPVAALGANLPAVETPGIPHSGPKAAGRRAADSANVSAALRLKWAELAVPLGVLAIVLAMVTPLPAFALDILIAFNISLSLIVLLVGLYISRPVEFSLFPTTLLLMTLFRLALNVSSSRLILLDGNTGTAAAGRVIEAFGQFVVGGNYVIGAVIFLVLIAIQYVVINHGAVRISEVTARFTLDALPGKQMSIDSDLNAGLIDESEARLRRRQLAAEAEFFGAMDGASRFTQRDAVASIIITAINIIAGFLIGVLEHGMELKQALATYTVLTIGDGLVTVIPALMISVSGGLIITRGNSDSALSVDFRRQVLGNPQPLLLAGGVLLTMSMFPGLPAFTFLALGSGLGYAGWRMRKAALVRQGATAAPLASRDKESLDTLLKVEPLAVEIGLGLVKMVEGGAESPLLRRIAGIRRQLAVELGYMMPAVRVTDNISLKVGEYIILLKGIEIARYEIPGGCQLAIQPGTGAGKPIEGTTTREPAFGLPAWWVTARQAEAAKAAGYTVVDPVSVLGTHLAETARRHAHELFSRQDAKKLMDRVGEENQRLVEDLVPKLLSLSLVQKVLQNLLREQVSIRDSVSILEALGEAAQITKNPLLLTEYTRQAIRRVVVQPYLDQAGQLAAYFLDAGIEQAIETAVEHGEHASHLNLSPQKAREIVDRFSRALGSSEQSVTVLTGAGSRHFLRLLVEPVHRNLSVLSHGEIPPGVKVISLGVVS